MEADGFQIRTQRHTISAKREIIATGGLSWPQTGSTGDGYRLAKALGHTIATPRPALVPLVAREKWPGEIAGLSVPEIAIRATVGGRKVATRGNLVFTYDGIGGPAPQDMSRFLTEALAEGSTGIEIHLDLAAALDEAALDRQLLGQLGEQPKKTIANVLAEWMPRRLASTLCRLARCDSDLPANQISKGVRRRLVGLTKSLPLSITGTRPIAEATVTQGGVSLKQIEPRTMASKVCSGLYFAGEVIDADGPCGGYNLQMCFAIGRLAGRCAADSVVNPHSSTT